ncbi:uncharacterized protein LOC129866043 [Salvelinus fontinalis]|uniref:uncharacterized protein LOC129847140 n=1 Tax=Salvelinus fontinalis TaxID=8038 RepID=UPI002485F8F2|nr:uncharacterized protein LOC129847140 [Salvelinus fontinalis]XP_055795150.1 uncharacterized protein LOC129866043 [Salvelinus fontinalis]
MPKRGRKKKRSTPVTIENARNNETTPDSIRRYAGKIVEYIAQSTTAFSQEDVSGVGLHNILGKTVEGLLQKVCGGVSSILNKYLYGAGVLSDAVIPVNLLPVTPNGDNQKMEKRWQDCTEEDCELIIIRLTGTVIITMLDSVMESCTMDPTHSSFLEELGLTIEMVKIIREVAECAANATSNDFSQFTVGGVPLFQRPLSNLSSGPSQPAPPQNALPTSTVPAPVSKVSSASPRSTDSGSSQVRKPRQSTEGVQRLSERQQDPGEEITSLVIETILRSVADLARHGLLPSCTQ